MKITNGKEVKDVSLKTWELIKHRGDWRQFTDKSHEIAIPVEVTEFMNRGNDIKEMYRRRLDDAGIKYDKRWGVAKLQQVYDNRKQEDWSS